MRLQRTTYGGVISPSRMDASIVGMGRFAEWQVSTLKRAGVAYLMPRRANKQTDRGHRRRQVVDRAVRPIVVICFARAQKRQHLAWDETLPWKMGVEVRRSDVNYSLPCLPHRTAPPSPTDRGGRGRPFIPIEGAIPCQGGTNGRRQPPRHANCASYYQSHLIRRLSTC